MRIVNAYNDTILFSAVPRADLSPGSMGQYAGKYFSDEVGSWLSVSVKDDKLLVRLRPSMEFTLTPTYRDGFTSPAGSFYFERDKKGKITAMRISVSRARNVLFKKTN